MLLTAGQFNNDIVYGFTNPNSHKCGNEIKFRVQSCILFTLCWILFPEKNIVEVIGLCYWLFVWRKLFPSVYGAHPATWLRSMDVMRSSTALSCSAVETTLACVDIMSRRIVPQHCSSLDYVVKNVYIYNHLSLQNMLSAEGETYLPLFREAFQRKCLQSKICISAPQLTNQIPNFITFCANMAE